MILSRRWLGKELCYLNARHLNSRHLNIRFTFETQLSRKLSFLAVLVDNSGSSCISSIYHKSTSAGLLTNSLTFTCFKYKVGLIYTLVNRSFKINSTTTGREKDLQQLSITLQRNSFPSHLIDKCPALLSTSKTICAALSTLYYQILKVLQRN